MSDPLYFNGRFTTTDERVLGVEDRGFQFGDSVYEVIKFVGKRLIFGADHYHRMEQGLAAIDVPSPWSEQEFRSVMNELLALTVAAEGTVYIQVTRGECRRTHFYPDGMKPTVVAYSRLFAFPGAAKKASGVGVITTDEVRWRNCQVKSTNLLGSVLAKKKAQRAGAEEALFIDGGRVTEGASSTFFAVREGRLITHPADHAILRGVVRDHVIGLALEAGIPLDQRPLDISELREVGEAFLTSTTQGVMPIATIDGRPVGSGKPGEITLRLQRMFEELERGEC